MPMYSAPRTDCNGKQTVHICWDGNWPTSVYIHTNEGLHQKEMHAKSRDRSRRPAEGWLLRVARKQGTQRHTAEQSASGLYGVCCQAFRAQACVMFFLGVIWVFWSICVSDAVTRSVCERSGVPVLMVLSGEQSCG